MDGEGPDGILVDVEGICGGVGGVVVGERVVRVHGSE